MIEQIEPNKPYPSDDELEKIEKWDRSFGELIEFISPYVNHHGKIYFCESQIMIVTCGWSGVEDIISSMKKNFPLWSAHWYSSHRGGSHIFNRNQFT